MLIHLRAREFCCNFRTLLYPILIVCCTTLLILGSLASTPQLVKAQADITPATNPIYLPYIGKAPTLKTAFPFAASTFGSSSVGEQLEPCATEASVPDATILSPASDWETAIQQAAPGATLLLHGGVYQARDKIWLPAGQPEHLITLKPYNCEPVALYTSLRPASYNVIAGLHIEALGIGDLTWVIRVDGKNKGPIRQVVIRNNTILGGQKDALKVSADVVDLTITGNHIDGGMASHVLNVQSEGQPNAPDQILITNNLLTKSYFNTPSEDMFQVIDAMHIEFSHNTCTDGHRMEQCVDIKETRVPLIVRDNLFDGTTLHLDGEGVDGSAGCMVIHEHDGHPENHLIEQNLFRNCRDTIIRFASEGGIAMASATVRNNTFISPDATDEDGLLIWRAQDVVFENNTMIRGTLKLGADGDPTKTPQNTVLKNNLFYHTRIDDRTQAPVTTYQCNYNLFFQTSGNLAHAMCQNSIWDADPLLKDIDHADFQPANNSPVCVAGENGAVIGMLACGS